MNWTITYLPEADADLRRLDNSVKAEIVRGIRKVSLNPGYPDGYGKPLGNFAGSSLSGLYKIKFRKSGVRVAYALRNDEGNMTIIVISMRADEAVYHEAERRRLKYDL